VQAAGGGRAETRRAAGHQDAAGFKVHRRLLSGRRRPAAPRLRIRWNGLWQALQIHWEVMTEGLSAVQLGTDGHPITAGA
jgi:hypothetical protein